jgi:hypothetical protein
MDEIARGTFVAPASARAEWSGRAGFPRGLIIANGSGNFRAHALIAIAAWLEVAKSRMNSRILSQSRSASFVVPTVPVLRR